MACNKNTTNYEKEWYFFEITKYDNQRILYLLLA